MRSASIPDDELSTDNFTLINLIFSKTFIYHFYASCVCFESVRQPLYANVAMQSAFNRQLRRPLNELLALRILSGFSAQKVLQADLREGYSYNTFTGSSQSSLFTCAIAWITMREALLPGNHYFLAAQLCHSNHTPKVFFSWTTSDNWLNTDILRKLILTFQRLGVACDRSRLTVVCTLGHQTPLHQIAGVGNV